MRVSVTQLTSDRTNATVSERDALERSDRSAGRGSDRHSVGTSTAVSSRIAMSGLEVRDLGRVTLEHRDQVLGVRAAASVPSDFIVARYLLMNPRFLVPG